MLVTVKKTVVGFFAVITNKRKAAIWLLFLFLSSVNLRVVEQCKDTDRKHSPKDVFYANFLKANAIFAQINVGSDDTSATCIVSNKEVADLRGGVCVIDVGAKLHTVFCDDGIDCLYFPNAKTVDGGVSDELACLEHLVFLSG